ncbi:hypothetical protein A0H81_12085 [Grifola frondosa]|uniref:MYND-type domain-containing protein n=1 Tax=Grifola frondosa TaxID=5627 RepID=A0A1C7LY98_GRIFR|nr:hypothetical protein A0H81_12085 [Grifola frondosa]
MSEPLIVDSKSARRQFIQCQQCRKSSEHNHKLFKCTGCDVTLYCSRECQRKHWPSHKTRCRINQEQKSLFKEYDKRILEKATSSGADSPAPLLTTQLTDELRAFASKFRPLVFQAAFNALDIANHCFAWQQLAFYVILERIPHVDPASRPWSRFRVLEAIALPYMAMRMMKQWDNGMAETVIEQTLAQQREHLSVEGTIGTITIMIGARCDAEPKGVAIHDTLWMAFGEHSQGAMVIEDKWRDTFVDTVERMCGRSPEAQASTAGAGVEAVRIGA